MSKKARSPRFADWHVIGPDGHCENIRASRADARGSALALLDVNGEPVFVATGPGWSARILGDTEPESAPDDQAARPFGPFRPVARPVATA